MKATHWFKPYKFLFIALFLLIYSCNKEQKVVIISTNDIHAAIDRFPYFASTVEKIRQQNPDNVILIDAGDRWTGNPFVDLAEPSYYPIIELMNTLGFEIGTVGNHEFDKGVGVLAESIPEMDFEIICANMKSDDGSPLHQLRPYAFKDVNGIRLCFVGLVTNFINGHPDGKDESFTGVTFTSPFEAAASLHCLKDSCDILIGLTHIGDDMDSVLAVQVPEFDLIIGGHSHTVIDTPRIYGNTVVTQTGSKLKYAGLTTLTFKNKKLAGIENRLLPLDTIPSPQFQAMVDTYNSNPQLLTPIGSTAASMSVQGVRNMITDAIKNRTKSDIAFYHSGGIRIDELPKGSVNTADMFRIDPFASEIYLVKMNEEDICSLIMNKFNDTANPKESHCIDLNPAGVNYTVVRDSAGDAAYVKLRPEKHKKIYIVAMPDYIYKIYRFSKVSDAEPTGLLVTDILGDMFRNDSPVSSSEQARATIE